MRKASACVAFVRLRKLLSAASRAVLLDCEDREGGTAVQQDGHDYSVAEDAGREDSFK